MQTRRAFLRTGIGVAAGTVATNSLLVRSASGNAATIPWEKLRAKISGDLVLPDDANYEIAHQLAFKQFDDHRPQAIAYCENPPDVRRCISFAQQNDVAVTARSGGHSYAGYSANDGLVIDVSRMNSVSVNGSTVTVESGAVSVDIVAALTPHNLALPAALYPTVGIAGFLQGGGVGWDTKPFGLAADRLVAAEVVLADGRLVRCDAATEPDLFWALRGGGGGNFGVVTKFKSRPFPADPMVMYDLSWPWDAAADVMTAWQDWTIGAPNELSNSFAVILPDATTGAVPMVVLNGSFAGTPETATQHLNRLIAAVGRPPTANNVTQLPRMDAMMRQYGCSSITVAQCHLTTSPSGQIARTDFSYERSRIFSRAIPPDGVDAILATFDQDRRAGQSRILWLQGTIGGRANEVAPSATAFVHRDAQFICSVKTGLPTGTPAAEDQAAAQQWSDRGFAIIDPYSTGRTYQNFLDPNLLDWQHAYYGSNYDRLVRVKHAYDPTGFFKFAQSIG